MDVEAAQFRDAVRQENRGKSVGRRRFTEAQRSRAVEYLSRRRGEGASVATIAEELGVGKTTLERWRTRGSRVVRVSVAAAGSVGIALVSPSGYRVECLSVEQAFGLLSRLG